MIYGISAFAQISGGLPPIQKIEPQTTSPPVRTVVPKKPPQRFTPVATGLPQSVFFNPGSFAITEEGKKAIAEAAETAGINGKIALTGFTANTGDLDANQELAKNRAKAVRDALISAGLAKNNIEMRPPEFITAATDERAARRVDIIKAQYLNSSRYFEPIDPNSLINDGWRSFIGVNGAVDEKKALDLTLRAIDLMNPKEHERSISIAWNNLAVFSLCAQDPRVRDFRKGMEINSARDYSDSMSLDNLAWGVYLQRDSVKNPTEFYVALKKNWPTHPVNRYVDSLGGKAPESSEQAYAVLERFANDGDPHAAMRIGYRYECYDRSPEPQLAVNWYKKAQDLHERNNASERTIRVTSDRIKRLVLILEGKMVAK
jgi:TPR repeat protein